MQNLLSDNLNMLMAKARINSNELAKLTGLPATTIKRIRTNEQSNPTIATLLPIAEHFAISINELIGQKDIDFNTRNYKINLVEIPILDWENCAQELNHHRKVLDKTVTELKISPNAFALKMLDEAAGFPKNSILMIDPDLAPACGDFVIITKRKSSRAWIKKYIVELDQIYLKSLVEGIQLFPFTNEHLVLGVVVQFKVNLK